MSDADTRPTHRPEARGLSTRAIRAASRASKIEQTPTSVAAAMAAAASTVDGRPVPALGAV